MGADCSFSLNDFHAKILKITFNRAYSHNLVKYFIAKVLLQIIIFKFSQ